VISASIQTQATAAHTLILVPHEVNESFLHEIESKCLKAGFLKRNVTRLSNLNSSIKRTEMLEVLIVDSVGLLAELYRLSQIAFVGGSFKKTVHSVMEPLAAGCLTIVGPLHLNNREAIEFQSEPTADASLTIVTSVANTDAFAIALGKAWIAVGSHDYKSEIREQVKKRGGATSHVVRWLEDLKLI
jgi:3-deoxy-D-manno-octulosonic-acid transferase